MAKRKRKVPLRTQLRRLEKKADRALSEFVRAKTIIEYNGKCPICERGPLIPNKPCRRDPRLEVPAIQCCFHFIRRKRKVLRWDIRNVTGACHKCNWVEYRDPDLSRAWYIRKYGHEQYLAIVEESKQSFIPDVDFLERVIKGYEEDLAKLMKDNPK